MSLLSHLSLSSSSRSQNVSFSTHKHTANDFRGTNSGTYHSEREITPYDQLKKTAEKILQQQLSSKTISEATHEKLKRSEERIEHLEGKIKLFQSDRAKLQAINKACHQKIIALEDNLDATRSVCNNLNDFCAQTERKIQELQLRRNEMEKFITFLRTELTNLNKTLSSSKEYEAMLTEDLNAQIKNVAELTNELNKTKEEKLKVNSELVNTKLQLEQTTEEYHKTLSVLSETRQKLVITEQQNLHLIDQCSSQQKEIKEAQDLNDRLSVSLKFETEKNEQAVLKLSTLEDDLKNLKEIEKAKEIELVNEKQRCESLQSSLTTLMEQKIELEDNLSKEKTESSALRQCNEELIRNVAQKNEELAQLSQKVKLTEDLVNEERKEKSEMIEEIKTIKDEANKMEKMAQEIQIKWNKTETEKNKEKEQLQQKNNALDKEITQLEEKLQVIENERTELEKLNHGLKEESKENSEQLELLRKESEKRKELEDKIGELEAQLSKETLERERIKQQFDQELQKKNALVSALEKGFKESSLSSQNALEELKSEKEKLNEEWERKYEEMENEAEKIKQELNEEKRKVDELTKEAMKKREKDKAAAKERAKEEETNKEREKVINDSEKWKAEATKLKKEIEKLKEKEKVKEEQREKEREIEREKDFELRLLQKKVKDNGFEATPNRKRKSENVEKDTPSDKGKKKRKTSLEEPEKDREKGTKRKLNMLSTEEFYDESQIQSENESESEYARHFTPRKRIGKSQQKATHMHSIPSDSVSSDIRSPSSITSSSKNQTVDGSRKKKLKVNDDINSEDINQENASNDFSLPAPVSQKGKITSTKKSTSSILPLVPQADTIIPHIQRPSFASTLSTTSSLKTPVTKSQSSSHSLQDSSNVTSGSTSTSAFLSEMNNALSKRGRIMRKDGGMSAILANSPLKPSNIQLASLSPLQTSSLAITLSSSMLPSASVHSKSVSSSSSTPNLKSPYSTLSTSSVIKSRKKAIGDIPFSLVPSKSSLFSTRRTDFEDLMTSDVFAFE